MVLQSGFMCTLLPVLPQNTMNFLPSGIASDTLDDSDFAFPVLLLDDCADGELDSGFAALDCEDEAALEDAGDTVDDCGGALDTGGVLDSGALLDDVGGAEGVELIEGDALLGDGVGATLLDGSGVGMDMLAVLLWDELATPLDSDILLSVTLTISGAVLSDGENKATINTKLQKASGTDTTPFIVLFQLVNFHMRKIPRGGTNSIIKTINQVF